MQWPVAIALRHTVLALAFLGVAVQRFLRLLLLLLLLCTSASTCTDDDCDDDDTLSFSITLVKVPLSCHLMSYEAPEANLN